MNTFEVALYLNITITLIGISCAYILNKPKLFLKTASGALSWISYLMFWPYFLFNTFTFALVCLLSREQALDEIIPNLYLGRQLWSFEAKKFFSLGIKSTLDLTCEFNEVIFIRKSNYLCIPLVDTAAPTLEQLERAVSWIVVSLSKGPILVHCALGHGRSATIIAGFLLKQGIIKDHKQAVAFIRSKRIGVQLNSAQRQILQQYQLYLYSQPLNF